MANRQKGTTRRAKDRSATIAQPESATATAHEVVAKLDRRVCEDAILKTLNALRNRTARPDGKRSTASTELDLATQMEAASMYLLDGRSTSQIRAALGARVAVVSVRVFENWISIVKREYEQRLNAVLAKVETDAELLAMKGDLAALAATLWSRLAIKVATFIDSVEYGDLDNNARHLLQRVAEGATQAAKVHTEAEKTRAQTEKLRRQLRQDVADAAKRSKGALSLATVSKIIDEVVGLPGREAAA
jgi:hypothetical protein